MVSTYRGRTENKLFNESAQRRAMQTKQFKEKKFFSLFLFLRVFVIVFYVVDLSVLSL